MSYYSILAIPDGLLDGSRLMMMRRFYGSTNINEETNYDEPTPLVEIVMWCDRMESLL